MQAGMVYHSLLTPELPIYFEQLSVGIDGPVDMPAFERAWREAIRRHPMLRASVVWRGVTTPLLCVLEPAVGGVSASEQAGETGRAATVHEGAKLVLEQHDCRDWEDIPARLEAFLEADRARGFALDQPPLMRLSWLHLPEGRARFVWSFHHVLLDGWSVSVLLSEVFAHYEALLEGRRLSLPPMPPHEEYVAWLQAQDRGAAEAFWREELKGFLAASPLPMRGRPASAEESDAAPGQVTGHLSAEATSRLHAAARQAHLTLSTLVQAAWAVLLSRYSGEADVLFGVTVAGRPPELAQVDKRVGLFINTLPVRVQVAGDAPVGVWLRQLQDHQLRLRQFEATALVDIQGWSEVPREHPLFESILVFENYPIDAALRDAQLPIKIVDFQSFERTNYPLVLGVVPGERLELTLAYDGRRFEAEAAGKLVEVLLGLLPQVLVAPMARLDHLSLLTEQDRGRLERWNATDRPYLEATLHGMFEAQVAREPEAIAVRADGETLTYGALERRSNQLAHHLRALGVGPEVRVGICLERCLNLVVALLGTLKAGGAYVPLDPSYPAARIQYMLEDARVGLLITEYTLIPLVGQMDRPVVCMNAARELLETLPTHTRLETRPTHTRLETRPTHTRLETRPTHTRLETRPTHALDAAFNEGRTSPLLKVAAATRLGDRAQVPNDEQVSPILGGNHKRRAGLPPLLRVSQTTGGSPPFLKGGRGGSSLESADSKEVKAPLHATKYPHGPRSRHSLLRGAGGGAAAGPPAGSPLASMSLNDDPALPTSPLDAVSSPLPTVDPSSEQLAYIIYTSGSTGKPKGVMISHRASTHHAWWMQTEYPVDRQDRVLQKAPISFDASVTEIFGALLFGAQLVMAPPETHRDPERLLALLQDAQITQLVVVPSLLRALLDLPSGLGACPELRRIFCGGEALTRDLVAGLARATAAELINCYGPSETAVDVTSWPCTEREETPIPIGLPVFNTRLYVLDSSLQPVPIGAVGQLFIGGIQLGRGYWDRPALTASHFIPDPFGSEPGARLYATGDRVRLRQDGALEYLARLDHQLKIRGNRVDLGEIEAALRDHEGVAAAVVVAREEGVAGQQLVAYVVPERVVAGGDGVGGQHLPASEGVANGAISKSRNLQNSVLTEAIPLDLPPISTPSSAVPTEAASVTHAGLRAFLQRSLPEYMLPSIYITLEVLPLTPNGKLDRRALPAPDGLQLARTGGSILPRTPIEALLAPLFAEVLGVDAIGIETHFFEAGGHSLLATQLISRVRSTFHLELPLRALFEAPTIAQLALRVEAAQREARGVVLPPLVARAGGGEGGRFPLSFAQQRLWFLEQLAPGGSAYLIPAVLELVGDLDVAVLRRAFEVVMARQGVLRTVFGEEEGKAFQQVESSLSWQMPLVDLRGDDALAISRQVGDTTDAVTQEARRLAQQEASQPFDLAQGPLMRAKVLRLGQKTHWLLLTLHHLITDGWSMGLLVQEVGALYTAFKQGAVSPLPALPIQYVDVTLWQRRWLTGEVLEAELKFWKQALGGETGAGPVPLELPTDHPRPPTQQYAGDELNFQLPAGVLQQLRALGLRHEAHCLWFWRLSSPCCWLGTRGRPMSASARRWPIGAIRGSSP